MIKEIEELIHNVADELLAVAVVFTFLYMSVVQSVVPEGMLVIVVLVMKYYFDKKTEN